MERTIVRSSEDGVVEEVIAEIDEVRDRELKIGLINASLVLVDAHREGRASDVVQRLKEIDRAHPIPIVEQGSLLGAIGALESPTSRERLRTALTDLKGRFARSVPVHAF